MKKVLVVFFGLICLLSSCKKYEEGPSFTLLSKKARLANTWRIDQFFENGADKTSDAQTLFKDFVLVIDKNNMKYTKTFKALGLLNLSETGSWKLSSDQSNVDFTPDDNNIKPYAWKILKLKNTSCGFSYVSNNNTYKLYLIQK
jgi:hypothetical protein